MYTLTLRTYQTSLCFTLPYLASALFLLFIHSSNIKSTTLSATLPSKIKSAQIRTYAIYIGVYWPQWYAIKVYVGMQSNFSVWFAIKLFSLICNQTFQFDLSNLKVHLLPNLSNHDDDAKVSYSNSPGFMNRPPFKMNKPSLVPCFPNCRT